MYLEKLVFLAQFYRLFPSIVSFVQVSGDTTELYQIVFLKGLGESNVIEVVKCIDGSPEPSVILLLN